MSQQTQVFQIARSCTLWCCFALALLGSPLGFSPSSIAPAEDRLDSHQDQQRQVAAAARALLAERCFQCHGPDGNHREADLRLDQPLSAPWVVPHDRPSSELWRRVTAEDESRMPPAGHGAALGAEELEILGRWIDSGAPQAMAWLTAPLPPAETVSRDIDPIDITLEQAGQRVGLAIPADADPLTLLRRVHLDLTGLPPGPEVIARYRSDSSDENYREIVDSLLESRAFGEHMASFWLDLVRYADTVGYHGDQDHPIWPYRDWVIDAFIRDEGFDRFSIAQLAGDRLESADERDLIATGYLRLLQTSHEGGVQKGEYLAKYSADRVRNFSEVWLGLTLGCAECHDHKFDPLTQRDFYQLAAFFADIDDSGTFVGTNTLPTSREPEIEVRSPLDDRRLAELDAALEGQLATQETPYSQSVTAPDESSTELTLERDRIATRRFRTMIVKSVEPRAIRILARGDWMDESSEEVFPATPASLAPMVSSPERRLDRLDLAKWLFDENRAVTSRVMVNRLWARFFGRGIAASLDDFGVQGEFPTHPELLDQLAADFVASGWRFKPLIRRFVTTRAYRSESVSPSGVEPWEHQAPFSAGLRRQSLTAEVLRDQALAASGLLADRPGGPSCRPYQPAGFYDHLNFPLRDYEADTGVDQYRRGIYVHRQRQFLHPMLAAFGAPRREECTSTRIQSLTPVAALTMLNDPTFVEAARGMVMRLGHETRSPDDADWKQLWQNVLTRSPSVEELSEIRRLYGTIYERYLNRPEDAVDFLSVGQPPEMLSSDAESLARLAASTFVARAILNLDEALHRP